MSNLEMFNYTISSTYIFQLKPSVDFNCGVASENGSNWFLSLFSEQTVYFIMMNSVIYNHALLSLTPVLKGGNKTLLKTILFK